ncbi:MAG: peptide deformylase [Pseudomonadota bacterium]
MAQREILIYPDPRLRHPAEPVVDFDDDLSQLVDDLIETLSVHDAIGLSATQIDDQRQVLIVDPPGEDEGPQVYINPSISAKSAWGFVEESCLSVPGVKGSVVRATRVSVSAQDATGKPFQRSVDGMHAVCLQHEMDHLAGKLFIDRFTVFGRMRARRAAKAAAAQAQSA